MFKKKKPTIPQDQNLNWLDRLKDDDEWVNLRSKTPTRKMPAVRQDVQMPSPNKRAFDVPKEDLEKVEVNIKLTVPKFDFLKSLKPSKAGLRERLLSKPAIVLVLLLLVVSGIVVGKSILTHKDNGGQVAGVNENKSGPQDLPVEKPSFPILYPGGKNYETIGKVVKISPPGNAPVYTYIDDLGGVQINVSQQQLPDKFKTGQDRELEALAKDFQATDLLKVDSVNVWHGRSEKGVESLLFIKGNLLITIRSAQPVEDDTWAAYISALHS